MRSPLRQIGCNRVCVSLQTQLRLVLETRLRLRQYTYCSKKGLAKNAFPLVRLFEKNYQTSRDDRTRASWFSVSVQEGSSQIRPEALDARQASHTYHTPDADNAYASKDAATEPSSVESRSLANSAADTRADTITALRYEAAPHMTLAIEDGDKPFIAYAYSQPVLNEQEERDAVERGDVDLLVQTHLKLVIKIARRYGGYGLPLLDLVSEGTLGLLKSIERFKVDNEHGARLATFAAYWIRASITQYIMNNVGVTKRGTTAADKRLFFKGAKIDDGTPEEIAERFGVRVEDVVEARKRRGRDLSLNTPIGVGDEEREWQDVLEDTRPNPEETIGDEQERALQLAQINAALKTLSEREREIVLARYEEEPVRLHELSERFRISRERIRQIQVRAEEKLRAALGVSELPPPRSRKLGDKRSRKCKGCGVLRPLANFRHWGRRCISCEEAHRAAA